MLYNKQYMEIELFSDSLIDITQDLIDKWNIHIIPLMVFFKGSDKTFEDGKGITPEDIYAHVQKTKVLPSTGSVSPQRFIEAFKPFVDQGKKIVYIGTGSGISGTFQNSLIAEKEFKEGDVTCIDSQTLSTGIALLVHKARLFIDEGKTPSEIKTLIEDLVPKLSVKFTIESMDYLYHGGRCSSLIYIFANTLHIHPLIRMVGNKLVVAGKPRGKYIKAIDELVKEFKKDLPNIDKDCVFITHSGPGDFEGHNYIYEKIKEDIPLENLHITQAHSVVSSHCGPHTIGILYILKK